MLAYELYISNKDKETITKRETPIKKIFFENNTITVENVHSPSMSNQPSIKLLQDWLSMPLNNASYDQIKLVDISVQSSQKSPYVSIYCLLEKIKESKDNYTYKIMMTIGKEPNFCKATYDITEQKLVFENLSDVKVRINKNDYFTSDYKNLFEQYTSTKILTQDGRLRPEIFKQIIIKFIENVKSHTMPDLTGLDKKLVPFWLYILPTNQKIIKKQENKGGAEFVDAFGNTSTHFSSNTTLTAKFLSSDDKAFTINCTTKDQFYKNLGIGDISLTKVELPIDNMMWVAGYEWAFVDMQNPGKKFLPVKGGILYQLKRNYEQLKKDHTRKVEFVMVKVMCMIRIQNKIEIILNENLTLLQQEKLLGSLDNIPHMAFEIMIPKTLSKGKPIWSDYLYTIKSFLTKTKIKRDYFITYFTRQLHKQKLDMIDKNIMAEDYFKRSSYMIKHFSYNTTNSDRMEETQQITPDEQYAHSIGMIARYYLDFKRKNNETNNSLLGILKYSKYDKQSLQNVLSKIGAGIALSKANNSDSEKRNEDLGKLDNQIQQIIPQNEIIQQSNDYAYFFYKGYFTGDK